MLGDDTHATYGPEDADSLDAFTHREKALTALREWVAKQIHVQTQSPNLALR